MQTRQAKRARVAIPGEPDDGPNVIPDHLLAQWIERIRNGERGAAVDGLARHMLQDFCMRQWERAPQSDVMLDWLADVLAGVLDHYDARGLLGLLPRPRHRPADPWRPAGEVALWLKLAESCGHAPAQAVEMAAEHFGKDTKTIERYRRDGAGMLDWWNPDPNVWARYFEARTPRVELPRGWRDKSALPVPTRIK